MDLPMGYTVFAPVNCGYDATDFKFGKLYQWSRNEGCDYKQTYDSDAGTGAIYTSPWNPTTDLWSSPATSQGPCPTGWRVSNNDELNSLRISDGAIIETQGWVASYQTTYFHGSTTNIAGRYYTYKEKTIFLPAAGYRESSSVCYDRNSNGYYWTTRKVTDPYSLFISSSNSSIYSQANPRAYSVRCVQNL